MIVSFYCKKCGLDQDLPAHKNNLVYNGIKSEWYENWCKKCKHKVIRYITQKHLDPYFRLSKKLRNQRKELARDLLQYGDEGFQTHYQKTYQQFQKSEADAELKKEEMRHQRDELLKKFGHDISRRNIIKKLYQEI